MIPIRPRFAPNVTAGECGLEKKARLRALVGGGNITDAMFAHMKKFITVLLGEIGLRSLLLSYHKSRLLSALADMRRFGTETSMPVWCSQLFQRHHEALRRLGFVERREFRLQQCAISGPECYRAFCQLMRARFADEYWSCAASGTRVVVTAQRSQMSEWQRFLFEYDQVA
jgi:hypothetical protein